MPPVTHSDEEPETVVKHKIILWKAFYDKLTELGLLPDPERVYRIVIDARVGEIAQITYYTYADDRLLSAVDVIEEAGPDTPGSETVVR